MSFKKLSTDELKQRIEEAESNLELNRNILYEILSSKESEQSHPQVLVKLLSENKQLVLEANTSFQSCIEAYGVNLIASQFSKEAELKTQRLIESSEEQIWELDYQLSRKERFLENSTDRRQQLETEEMKLNIFRHMETSQPFPETIPAHNDVEETRDSMRKLAKKLHRFVIYKERLQHLCNDTRKRINTLKTVLSNPLNRKHSAHKINISSGLRRQYTIKNSEYIDDQSLEESSYSHQVEDFETLSPHKLKHLISELKKEVKNNLQKLIAENESNKDIQNANRDLAEQYKKVFKID